MLFVPVVDKDQKPLMPTTPNRAALWIKSGKATPFWKKGVFCVRLNQEPSARNTQKTVIGVDPGSKKEGYTIKSLAHTYLNIQADAVTWVKESVKTRRMMRRSRRQRNTPYRSNRMNRARGGIPPSTKARWQWKLRILNWIRKMFPITDVTVEDIAAETKPNQKRWNQSFSPLEVGKQWFYGMVENMGVFLWVQAGYETSYQRDVFNLMKSPNKLSNDFSSHCVDSWVMAEMTLGGTSQPDNKSILLITPLQYRRRSLHYLQPKKGGERHRHGGTMSEGFKRGSVVKHPKYGITYIGGNQKGRVSLHSLKDGLRLCVNAKPSDIKFLSYSSWRVDPSYK